MRHTDIAIVGGGLAGSMAAAMLGRAGTDVTVVDPHEVYPPDFRCEKLDGSQIELLRKTGLAEPVLRASTPDQEVWIVRYGRLIEKRRNNQSDILYDTLVNTVRGEIPPHVARICAKVESLSTGPGRQRIVLSNGEEISARLIVLATGLNNALRQSLGIEREELSRNHSVSIGFDLIPVGRPAFDFHALTYYPERAADRMAYMTLFPIGSTMRANLFVYRDIRDPWLQTLRNAPKETLLGLMPALGKLAGAFAVSDDIKIRPVDLYVTKGCRQAGVVLVGDSFSTSCPAAGTGVNKVFTDVERLCNVHIPNWLASEGMGAGKIAQFYDDPVKQSCETHSRTKAFYLRSLSTERNLSWQARRLSRFVGQLGAAALRQTREHFGSEGADKTAASPGSTLLH